MAYEAQGTIDTLLQLKDAGLVAATAAAQVGGVNRILDVGSGHYSGTVQVDASAIESATGDELFTIIVEGSDSSDFSTGTPLITPLAVLFLGAGAVMPGAGATTSAAGRYFIPFRNEVNGHIFRYVRLETVVAGTIATGINYTAYITKNRP